MLRFVRPRPFAALAALTVACGGCGKSEYPTPDGSSGVQGTCWLPATEDGERIPWATAIIMATVVNSDQYEYKNVATAQADAQGRFRMSLIPGDYLLGLSTSPELKGKMTRPVFVKVAAGQFTEVNIEFDQVYPEDLRKGP